MIWNLTFTWQMSSIKLVPEGLTPHSSYQQEPDCFCSFIGNYIPWIIILYFTSTTRIITRGKLEQQILKYMINQSWTHISKYLILISYQLLHVGLMANNTVPVSTHTQKHTHTHTLPPHAYTHEYAQIHTHTSLTQMVLRSITRMTRYLTIG